MPAEEIVVLANSRKMGGRCVAGISRSTGCWVRPVSGRPEGELMPRDCAVDNRPPRVLDVVRFRYREKLEDPAQPENVLIDGGDWELVDAIAPESAYEALAPYLSAGPALLGGTEKGVPEAVAQEGLETSLSLVEPSSIEFASVQFDGGGRRKPRAVFELSSRWYDLGITDSIVAPKLRGMESGTYSAADLGFPVPTHTLLTVSLTEPWRAKRWKLAAAVLFLP